MELQQNPRKRTSLGSGTYKIRLRIKSKGKGKGGGARVISYIETELIGKIEREDEEITVNLLTIYDKSEVASISETELKGLIRALRQE